MASRQHSGDHITSVACALTAHPAWRNRAQTSFEVNDLLSFVNADRQRPFPRAEADAALSKLAEENIVMVEGDVLFYLPA